MNSYNKEKYDYGPVSACHSVTPVLPLLRRTDGFILLGLGVGEGGGG